MGIIDHRSNGTVLPRIPINFPQSEKQPMNGDTQIYVSGREYKMPGNLVTYEEIVKMLEQATRGGEQAHHRHARHRLRRRLEG